MTAHALPCRTGAALVLALALLACGAVRAQAPPPEQVPDAPARTAFKVCQDPNNLPFSNLQGQGYQNKIAELFARDLSLPLVYFSFPNRMNFIRNTLRFKLPTDDYPCDLVIDVPAEFDQVAVTKPYYRSTYSLVYPKGKALDGVRSSDDLAALPPARLAGLRIGLFDRSPASQWLVRHHLEDHGVPYKMMNADPDQYPGQIIERDLAEGRIDAAIVWGPIAGYFARRVRSPELVVVPMKSEPGVPMDYAIAMGVRYGEPQWKQQIEGLIAKHRAEIRDILLDYGVPLIDDKPGTSK